MDDRTVTYDDGKTYDVKLTRPVEVDRSKLLPLHIHEMSGGFLNRVIEQEGEDVLDSAEAR